MSMIYNATPPEGARWAHVRLCCIHHPDSIIGELSTFDGVIPMFSMGPDGREEYIGWMPDEATNAHLSQSPIGHWFSTASAPPDQDDRAHMRITLACDRQSCSYRPQIREENIKRLHDLVLRLWADGGSELVVTNLDKWLRPADPRHAGRGQHRARPVRG